MIKYLLFILLLTGCATTMPWTTEEKVLLGISCLAAAVDTYATTRFLDNEDNWEVNPILGRHPSDTKVVMSMIGSQTIAIILAHYLPEWRSWILGVKTGFNTVGTINNLTLDW